MKKLAQRIVYQQDGQVLIIALVMMVIGALLVTSSLNLMGTGFMVVQKTEQRTRELYAADAGVGQALAWLGKTPSSDSTMPKLITDPPKTFSILTLNTDKKVFAFLKYNGKVNNTNTYVITSVAGLNVVADTNMANQPSPYTKIVAVVTDGVDFGDLMNNVITSNGPYTIKNSAEVSPPIGENNGPITDYPGVWPTASDLSACYWRDVNNPTSVTPYPSASINVSSTSSLNDLYRNGPLSITKGAGGSNTLITLHGTVYITGDTLIGSTGDYFTLNLNGQTIYVSSPTAGNQYALKFGSKCTITGSGAIIAVGNIEFKPSMSSNPSNYVLVMSVSGKTFMQPGGSFYGTLAGNTEVDVWSGSTVTWTNPSSVPGGGINVPRKQSFVSTWEIKLD